MRIDWIAKLRHLTQTLAFCLAVSALQFFFMPDRPYQFPALYSVCIGSSIWALIDFGRHLFASAAETGWPRGAAGLLLPIGGIFGGYLVGTLAADWWFGVSSWTEQGRAQLPTSIVITLLAGSVATYYFYNKNKSAWQESKMTEARHQATGARLKLLESQLEPHMLFNTLANLRALIGTDRLAAQQMLDRLIDYLRATLAASRADTHSLATEFDRLRDYLELMQIRMGPRLRFSLELPDELRERSIPPLLLQPLVENAIKHGLEPSVDGGTVSVRAWRQGSELRLEVTDTGVGMDARAASGGSGFGLAQVRERLATLWGTQARMSIASNPPHGTRIALTLP